MEQAIDLAALIRDVPDFPEPGIIFRDLTPLLASPEGLRGAIAQLTTASADLRPDYIAGIESRGFWFGPAMAVNFQAGFVPIRKPGKLPAATHSAEYALEYGRDRLEVHQDAFRAGARVLIVDDVIATGGTAAAAAQLVAQAGAEVVGLAVLVELAALAGRDRLPAGVAVRSIVTY